MKPRFADLHCHPAFRPYNNETFSLWDPPQSDIDAIRAGKRASCYSQSDMPKLTAGNVSLIFAALYPFEKPWVIEQNLLIRIIGKAYKAVKSLLYRVGISKNPASRHFSLRDDLLNGIFLRFSKARYLRIRESDYWEELKWELRLYEEEQGVRRKVRTLVEREGDSWNPEIAAELREEANEAAFRLLGVESELMQPEVTERQLQVVLTLEGMHALSMDPNLNRVPERVLLERIEYLKTQTSLFFITFAHHFDNGLCGHARSMPLILRRLGLVKQEKRINEGFSPVGMKALSYLLSIRQEGDKWLDDPSAGRRILVDIKHMSIQAREEYYQIVSNYNENHPNTPIPIIGSHMGYSGLSMEELKSRVHTGKEVRQKQIWNGYNRWSINLGSDEIQKLVASKGLIGLSFDQNVLGMERSVLPFWGNRKRNSVQLMGDQILDMVEAAGDPEIWNCLAIGTDFDGVIDPVDAYATALDFPQFRNDLIEYLHRSLRENHRFYYLESADRGFLAEIVDQICIGNAERFVQQHLINSLHKKAHTNT